MRLTTVRVPEWPVLGWLAVCRRHRTRSPATSGTTSRRRTSGSARRSGPGPFVDGGFDETDIVFGSGVRVRDDRVVFVPSGGPIDRLHSIRTDDGLLVSNSLACAAGLRGRIARSWPYQRYREMFSSLVAGIGHYSGTSPPRSGRCG